MIPEKGTYQIFTARQRSLRRSCFHRCLSVHVLGGVCLWSRGRGCLPHTTPPGRPAQADTAPWADTPLPSACWDTPTPPSACWDKPPLPNACLDTPPSRWILRDTVNKRTVRIPLEYILILHCYHFFLS